MAQRNPKTTAKDYRAMPEGPPWLQLIEGELIQDPSPSVSHQVLSLELASLLRIHVQMLELGVVLVAPMDVWLSDHNVLQPDILFVSKQRRQILHADGIHGAPELMVEILSPTSSQRDLTQKRLIYEMAGVTEYWLVDPPRREITRISFLGQKGQRPTKAGSAGSAIRSPLFPGLVIQPKSLFAVLEAD